MLHLKASCWYTGVDSGGYNSAEILQGVNMVSKLAIERITGVLFILLLVSLILSFTLGTRIDTDRADFRDTLLDIENDIELNRISVGFDTFPTFLSL